MRTRKALPLLLTAVILFSIAPLSTTALASAPAPVPNMGEADSFEQLRDAYSCAQSDSSASEEVKVRNTIDTLFLAELESIKNLRTMDTRFLFADPKSADLGGCSYEMGRTGLRVAYCVYYDDAPKAYSYEPQYADVVVDGTTATVRMTPATELTLKGGVSPDVFSEHTFVLSRESSGWKIVSNTYTDDITVQYPAGTDFAKLIRDYRKTQDDYKVKEKEYLRSTRGDFKANPRQSSSNGVALDDIRIMGGTYIGKDKAKLVSYAYQYTEQYDKTVPGDEWATHTYNPLFPGGRNVSR